MIQLDQQGEFTASTCCHNIDLIGIWSSIAYAHLGSIINTRSELASLALLVRVWRCLSGMDDIITVL